MFTQGRRKSPLEGVRLNLPEFTWLVSCSIFNDHYSFKFVITLLSGYLDVEVVGELITSLVEQKCSNAGKTINNFQCVGHSLTPSDYYKANLGWVRRKIFKINALKWLESANLRLIFANRLSHMRAVLLIFEAGFAECVLQLNLHWSGSALMRMIQFAGRKHIGGSNGRIYIFWGAKFLAKAKAHAM